MDVMTFSDARAHFKSMMDRVLKDKQEVLVTRKKTVKLLWLFL